MSDDARCQAAAELEAARAAAQEALRAAQEAAAALAALADQAGRDSSHG